MKKLFIALFAVISMFALSASYAGFVVDVGVDAPVFTMSADADTGNVPNIGGGSSNTYSKTTTEIGHAWRISSENSWSSATLCRPTTTDYGA